MPTLKMKPPLIAHEQSKLVIGKLYSVAHAVIERLDGIIHHVPVNPFKHKDPQFGADFYHYHIDGRFGIDAWCRDLFEVKKGITNHAVICDNKTGIIKRYQYTVKEIIYLKKRCVRFTTGVNPPLTDKEYNFNAEMKDYDFPIKQVPSKYAIWYETMIGKSCAGRKCPHFGTVMIERDGVLVCPLHNLKGDIDKEVIINY